MARCDGSTQFWNHRYWCIDCLCYGRKRRIRTDYHSKGLPCFRRCVWQVFERTHFGNYRCGKGKCSKPRVCVESFHFVHLIRMLINWLKFAESETFKIGRRCWTGIDWQKICIRCGHIPVGNVLSTNNPIGWKLWSQI